MSRLIKKPATRLEQQCAVALTKLGFDCNDDCVGMSTDIPVDKVDEIVERVRYEARGWHDNRMRDLLAEYAEYERFKETGEKIAGCQGCFSSFVVSVPPHRRSRTFLRSVKELFCPDCRSTVSTISHRIATEIPFENHPHESGWYDRINDWIEANAIRTADDRWACPFCHAGPFGFEGYATIRSLHDFHLINGKCSLHKHVRDIIMPRHHSQVKRHLREQHAKDLLCSQDVDMGGTSSVYLILNPAVGHVKIGMSKNPAKRLSDLQTSASTPLRLLASKQVADAPGVERSLHQTFYSHHVMNEWFRDAEEIRSAFGVRS